MKALPPEGHGYEVAYRDLGPGVHFMLIYIHAGDRYIWVANTDPALDPAAAPLAVP